MIRLFAFLGLIAGGLPAASDVGKLQEARNVGLAALEEGNLPEAQKRFAAVRRLAPGDPLGWADGAVAALRGKDLPAASRLMAEAIRLSPSNARVAALEGTRRELSGDVAGAIQSFERAAMLDPKDLASRWSAARLRSDADPRRAIRDIEASLAQAPANLYLLVRLGDLLRQAGEGARAAEVYARLSSWASGDPRLEKALADAKGALSAGDSAAAALKYRIVENLLRVNARFQQARHDVDPGVVGLPLEDWSGSLAAAVQARAAVPIPVTFSPVAGAFAGLRDASVVRVFGPESREVVFAGTAGLQTARWSEGRWHLAAAIPASGASDVAVADVMNTGSLDLATPGGLWLADGGAFRRTAIASGERVVPLDYDSDGDLDLYVSSPSGDHLLRNNLDGSWADVTVDAGVPRGTASRAAVAADLDRDGDVDLVLLQAEGGIAVLDNLRGGKVQLRDANLPKAGVFRAAAAGDLNGDGRVDLILAGDAGTAVALNQGDGTFAAPRPLPAAGVPLLFDYDNDGILDLFLARPDGPSTLLRGDGSGNFAPATAGSFPAAIGAEAVDYDGDGDLDLVLVTASGGAELFENRGGNANAWIDVVLEALPTGSAKVNRFGFGSEVEVKAQNLYVYRVVSRPVTRLGLGASRKAEVVRVVWTNGVPQNTLSPPVKTVLKEVQQLKGSCPFLYAFDGSRWTFVTDVLGRSPAGLLFDGIHQAAADTREWLVVSGQRLAPRDGRLTLDFTEELWETAYFDLAQLSAVDHPAGVVLVPDEKMVPPPFPPKALFTVSRPFTPRAVDGDGRDRTSEIAAEDGVFLGGFTPTRYQGIVAPHALILELPEARFGKSVMLYLTGWILYSDTSIAVSLSQRRDLAPLGPVLEVPDGSGGWKVAIAAMGYPAGKTKTMPVDLSGVLNRADPRVRIRTNLAVSWDRIAYTVDEARAPMRQTAVPLSSANLFFRGFSEMSRESPDGPQIFLHDAVSVGPRWADMAGLYTRYGDVRELLTDADDRYVIMKGGDAVRLEFDASSLPPLAAGWVRDYLIVLDGWDKDADKNTVMGQTVEPLPFHGMDDARYGTLTFPDSDGHRAFAREYLTRRGGPDEFRDALRREGP